MNKLWTYAIDIPSLNHVSSPPPTLLCTVCGVKVSVVVYLFLCFFLVSTSSTDSVLKVQVTVENLKFFVGQFEVGAH
jgi:hypothetical protein